MKNSAYGIIAWFVTTLFVIYSFCLNTAASVFQNVIQSSLHASAIGSSFAMSAFIVGFASMQIPAGYLLDRFNARYIVSAGVLVLAVGNILASFSNSLVIYSISNLIQGIGGSFAFIAVAIIISQWFSNQWFPILFGFTQTLSCFSSGIIHYIMADRLLVTSWNTIYQYLGICGLILFALTIIFVKSPANHSTTPASLTYSIVTVFKNKQIMLCAMGAATSFGILLAYASFWYIRVQNFYSVNTNESLIISSFIFTGIGIGTPLLGFISNKIKSRNAVLHVSLVLGTMMLLTGIYLPHFDTHSLIINKAISFLIGLLLSGSMLFYTVVSENASDTTRGVSLSIINTCVFLLNAFMMFIPYLLITNQSKMFFTYLWILPFSVMISILVLYFIKDTYRASTNRS